MERPEFRSAIRRHVVRLRVTQACIAGSLIRQYRPTPAATRIRADGVLTHVCTSGGRAAYGPLF